MPKLPDELLNNLSGIKDFDYAAFVAIHAETEKITSIRLNPFKPAELDFPLSRKVPWCASGFVIAERPQFTYDPLFHAGCYYVQEPASMFIEQAITQLFEPQPTLKVLDIAASPGGKSTHMASLISQASLLVCNEIIKTRAAVLAQNLSRWGTCNTIVTNSEPSKFEALPGYFDVVVADVPCSGSGLFRKQPDAINEWSMAHVHSCALRQTGLLSSASKAVADGGILIYSTCSYSPEENEEVVRHLLSTGEFDLEELTLAEEWGITATGAGYRFFPYKTISEGFFCAVLRKKGASGERLVQKPVQNNEIKQYRSLLDPFVDVRPIVIKKIGERIHFFNETCSEFYENFGSLFYLRKCGTVAGEVKGNDFVPDQELAWSNNCKFDGLTAELDYADSVQYLKKQAFSADHSKQGWCLVKYKSVSLGWAKILSNRVNNYYPNELRITR